MGVVAEVGDIRVREPPGSVKRSGHVKKPLALAVLVLLAMAAVASASASAAPLVRPNIILILSDDQDYSAETIAKMPYLYSHTPQAGGGWYRFDNAFINNPTCCPSRATILTGEWSHHTGVEVTAGAPPYDDSDTIATRLHDAGYRTGYIGKYHLGTTNVPRAGLTYVPPGWDDFQEFANNTRHWYFDYRLNENGTLVDYGSAPQDYSTDVLRDKALHFIGASAGAPFFLVYAPRGPHNRWTAAPRDVGHYAREPVSFPPSWNEDTSDKPAWWAARPAARAANRTAAMRKEWDTLLSVDDAVKAIHQRVQGLGLMSNTVILYMSDNGYSFGEHRWGEKRCVYDSCARTPLYVKYGSRSQGWTFDQIVGNEDLAATFAAFANTAPPAGGDGQSMESMIETHATPAGWDNEELLRSANPGDRETGEPPDAWALRIPGYLYAETTSTGERELYYLAPDPWELNNVADNAGYGGVVLTMAARLAELRAMP
jgi:N-acetylglucosamine-6-sulfatase